MRKIIKLSLLVAFALLNSCSKSDKNGGTQTPVKKLKYLTQEVVGSSTTNYTYDSNKKLKSTQTGGTETTYAYYDDGTLYLVTKTSGNNRDTWETSYNGKKLSTIKHIAYQNNLQTGTDTYTFTYSDNGLLGQWRVDGDDGLSVTRYIYNDKNVIVKADVNDGSVINDYTYDDKKSRFTNLEQTLKNVITGGFDYVIPNNIVKQSSYSDISLQTTVYNYTYTYDSDGYPTSRTLTFKAGSQTIQTNSTFTYSEF